MGFVAVSGTVYRFHNAPWAKALVTFSLDSGSYTATTQFPKGKKTIEANDDGLFTIPLWVNEEGAIPSRYTCTYPTGETFSFTVPSGISAATISYLRGLSETIDPPEPNVLATTINAVINARQFERNFTDADLSIAGALAVVHNLNTYPSAIGVWTNDGIPVEPDRVTYSNSNAVTIKLSSFRPIPGTWRLSIGA